MTVSLTLDRMTAISKINFAEMSHCQRLEAIARACGYRSLAAAKSALSGVAAADPVDLAGDADLLTSEKGAEARRSQLLHVLAHVATPQTAFPGWLSVSLRAIGRNTAGPDATIAFAEDVRRLTDRKVDFETLRKSVYARSLLTGQEALVKRLESHEDPELKRLADLMRALQDEPDFPPLDLTRGAFRPVDKALIARVAPLSVAEALSETDAPRRHGLLRAMIAQMSGEGLDYDVRDLSAASPVFDVSRTGKLHALRASHNVLLGIVSGDVRGGLASLAPVHGWLSYGEAVAAPKNAQGVSEAQDVLNASLSDGDAVTPRGGTWETHVSRATPLLESAYWKGYYRGIRALKANILDALSDA